MTGLPGDAAATDAATQIAGEMAHDFNNILTVISGSLALAERHAAGNPKLIRLLANMRLATERGVALTQQLMALAAKGHPPAAGAGRQPAVHQASAARQILVVEDDPQVAEVAVAALEGMGHKVVLRPDAASALALLRTGPAFDLVFSDIVMPGGMSGIELAEAISASFPLLPILLATGYSGAALAPGALRFPVLAKPYSVQELSRRVAVMVPAPS
jgi:CheY-like chemotaxis protein